MKKIFIPFLCFFLAGTAFGDVKLPKIFSDNMVLQRGQDIPVWGWADPGEKITVKFNGQAKSVRAGKNGKWSVSLKPESAGGPYQLSVKGKNSITLNNVLVGDIWICSGQSNMEWLVRNSDHADEEIAKADNPLIRHFKIPDAIASRPQQDIPGGEWKICTPQNAGDFTAVGYFFGRALVKELNIPIGLINSSWGGTHSETWTSREAFEGSEEFKAMIDAIPQLDLDSLAHKRAASILKKIEALQGHLDAPEAAQAWKDPGYDDSKWQHMQLPGLWEQQSLPGFDGVVWFRRKFTVKGSDAGRNAVLEAAMIDDSDETYVNGVKVGEMKQKYSEHRSYPIPAGILKEGNNVIAIRVEDTGGGGGIYGDAADLRIRTGGSDQSLAGDWSYRVESISESSVIGPNSYPSLLFNAMINPLLPLSVKGVIWYQGEANAGRAFQYRKAFPLMITDWRKHWGRADLPFYFVQLASFNADNGNSKNGSTWAELREAQTLTLSVPNTGMAVTTDIGNPGNIHPRNKQDVGRRLAAIALNKTYGKNNVYSGPVFEKMEVDNDKAIISFSHTADGLVVKDKYGYVKGFEIAGEDHRFTYAKAFIRGNTVVVYQDGVTHPVAVRFGWADDASDDNLYNSEGFPAGPFRTDNWRAITEGAKFQIGE